jgi:hypothetical protein
VCAIIQNLQVPLDQTSIPAYVPFSVVIEMLIHEIINRELSYGSGFLIAASLLMMMPADADCDKHVLVPFQKKINMY